ncbi:hypothetical protein [Lyngbya aestuarii]|uniref:hypothetical protein n=1 Tax=Lyngbya aestuarii TaxID=118322 RepID=UPI00403D833F
MSKYTYLVKLFLTGYVARWAKIYKKLRLVKLKVHEKILPQLESATSLLRLTHGDYVKAILRYYLENKVYLTPSELLKSSDFYT